MRRMLNLHHVEDPSGDGFWIAEDAITDLSKEHPSHTWTTVYTNVIERTYLEGEDGTGPRIYEYQRHHVTEDVLYIASAGSQHGGEAFFQVFVLRTVLAGRRG